MISWQYFSYDTVTSTNLICQERINNHQHGDFECHHAKKQTQGIGRLQRDWQSPHGGNLYVSFIVPLPISRQEHSFQISLIAGVALIHAINSINYHKLFKLKWPNDVLYNDAKIAGILCQQHHNYLIIGCGINITEAPTLKDKKTAYLQQITLSYHYDNILYAFANKLLSYYHIWKENGFLAIQEEYCQLGLQHNEVFTTTIDSQKRQLTFKAIDNIGRLVALDDQGKEITLI